MNEFFAIWTHAVGKILIFLTSAMLTFFFFFTVLPSSLWVLAVLCLVMFEYGVIHWYDYHRQGAENPHQAVLSVVMVGMSLIAVATSNTFELMKFLGPYYGIDFPWMKYAAWILIGVFPANVVAVVIEGMISNEHSRLWELKFDRDRASNFYWTDVKEIETVDRKQLDGPTEEIETVNVSNSAAEARSIKKKFPQMKQGVNKQRKNLSSTPGPGNPLAGSDGTESR